jgi:hypothetical protein
VDPNQAYSAAEVERMMKLHIAEGHGQEDELSEAAEIIVPLQICLGNRLRVCGGGRPGDCRALLWRELFHAGLAAGFPTLAADLRQVFRYRGLPNHFIDSKAASGKASTAC